MLQALRTVIVLGIIAVAGFVTPFGAEGGLPIAVDGQPLPSLAPMIKQVTPAVVNIATRGRVRVKQNPLMADPFFRRFFNLPPLQREKKVQSVGSGVIVDALEGYVLTNNHVIANADQIVVTLRDRRQLTAELVGTDPATDIAVLRIPAENLTALTLGDSDALEVGDFVVAIGNPFGIGQTVTSGIVSALRRSGLGIEGIEDFIQTDASINPGNSGGALVTLDGQLIGINTAIIGPSGGNVGIGFAIPTNMALQIMDQLVTYGEVRRGGLGVQGQDMTPALAEALGVAQPAGAIITRVAPDGPAGKAGLEAGDIVVSVNGDPVRDVSHLRNVVGLMRAGETIELTVLRDGLLRKISLEPAVPPELRVSGEGVAKRLAGATLGPIQETSKLYGKIEGVAVVKVAPNSPAWRTGLRKNDVIVEVNHNAVRDIESFKKALGSGGKRLVLKIQRGNSQVFIVVS